jgi:hypothetical protein
VLKFSLIPGGDAMGLLAMMTLAGIYYPLGFLFFNQIRLRDIFKKTAYKDVTAVSVILAVAVGAGLSTVVVGSSFKILDFTGANAMLLAGLVITGIASVVAVVRFIKNRDANSKFILWRAALVGGMGMLLFFTPALTIVKLQYRAYPAYVEAYTNYANDPGNEALRKKMQLERNRIGLTEEEFKMYEKSVNGQ